MGTKAFYGYQVFCRQDFIGLDYALIDCSTHTPLPDYYTGVLFGRLMGTGVLSADTAATTDGVLRSYAHCSRATPGGVTVLFINTAEATTYKMPPPSTLAGSIAF